MGKLLIVLIIVSIGWYIQNNYDFAPLKQNAIEGMKKEKTIQTVNSKRSADQEDIDDVVDR